VWRGAWYDWAILWFLLSVIAVPMGIANWKSWAGHRLPRWVFRVIGLPYREDK
jgi:hypothetical protein